MGGAMNRIETNDSTIMESMRKAHGWRMAFFGLVILLAGIAIGAASALILQRPRPIGPFTGPEFVSEAMIRGLRRQLQLSPEQMEKVESILQKHMQKLHEIRMNARPQIAEQLRLMNEEISSVLTEQQRQIWQERLYRLQRQFRQRGPRRGDDLEEPPFRRGQRGLGPPVSPPNEPLIR
jgi:Spy/CpxP family protein refolding chaperone